jgi:hypothetical protein
VVSFSSHVSLVTPSDISKTLNLPTCVFLLLTDVYDLKQARNASTVQSSTLMLSNVLHKPRPKTLLTRYIWVPKCVSSTYA